MNNIKQWINILVVGMSLGTAWAIRGQFGHEQGAAWAGAIGGLALILVSGRKDWYKKMMMVALASAIGWGAGGMISYGRVVGYGRTDNFINVFYGLGMLFVIGALFGLLGGGLVGLTLDANNSKKVKWGQLLAEMTAGGIISYYFLIEQLGFKMTPPRSEAWAVCFGAGLAMLWNMARDGRNSAIRVAIYSTLGAGFGFGFGNFLQVLGNVLEINFNMWNVMEYSIGFFGGTGMAYGVFSSEWQKDEAEPLPWVVRLSTFFTFVFFPLIIYRESLTKSTFLKRLGEIPNLDSVATISHIMVILAILAMIIFVFVRLRNRSGSKKEVFLAFISLLIVYTFISYAVKGLFAGKTELNHHLYIVNILVIIVLQNRNFPEGFANKTTKIPLKIWIVIFVAIVIILALLALIAVGINPGLGGGHDRFSFS